MINRSSRRHFLKSSAAGILQASLMSSFSMWPHRWKYIVIHHSAGPSGSLKSLRTICRQRQGKTLVNCMAYHFAIGNGNGMSMGRIVSGRRWKYRLWGIHVSGRNRSINVRGIGICLIGNYHENPLPEQQYKALVSHTVSLMKHHGIPPENILLHGKISREKTLCPGKYFPEKRFRKDISQT